MPEAPDAVVIVAGRPQEVAARLREVRTEINARFVEMGELLLEAHRNNHASALGYQTFEAYAEEHLGMSYRRAKYLADCYEIFIEQLQMPRATLVELGWTRAKEILPIATDANAPAPPGVEPAATQQEKVQQWVDYAQAPGENGRQKTTNEINLAVRTAQAPPGQAPALREYAPITIPCFKDEREIIEGAINLAKLELGTDRVGRALMMICQDYAGEAAARQLHAMPAIQETSSEVNPEL